MSVLDQGLGSGSHLECIFCVYVCCADAAYSLALDLTQRQALSPWSQPQPRPDGCAHRRMLMPMECVGALGRSGGRASLRSILHAKPYLCPSSVLRTPAR